MPPKTVLHVDDELIWHRTIQRLFARIGPEHPDIDYALGYSSALEKARSKAYDLIILDGLQGQCFPLYEALREIPHQSAASVVILSCDPWLQLQAQKQNIHFYDKVGGISQLVEDYQK